MIIPPPVWTEDEVYVPPTIGEDEHERIRVYLDVRPWKCPTCKLTNFGRNEKCAYWLCKTPRPCDITSLIGRTT